ncbi:OmpA family protein [Mucilaginibacter terrae]|uniref:OOP family OmpA-OmpF porin n=1 Tax=Mucilaginibacter terrae TaxID=1955052 RepID=A0ABU3GP15_9SPHI|nr:OmpA family protein [Mucilaginibacter terrae]MDT3401537.1 OOP family OmpA-OmpF porin [Mucilaginibacter terrae]
MKLSRINLVSFALVLGMAFQACKTKKVVTKPAEPAPVAKPAPPKEEKPAPPPPAPPKQEVPTPTKPNYNFNNIQFEFNSAVLKTGSYETLDKIAAEIKKDALKKFTINGHSSAEGTAAHNQSLSEDRANSVKQYLVNAGVDAASLNIKGWGESKPLNSNGTEEARAINRRVEVKIN